MTLSLARIARSLALLSLAVPLAGCCPLIPTGDSREVWVREGQDGGSVTVRVGQTLVVDLEAAPTTGYSWQVQGADRTILQQAGEAEFESHSPLLGAAAQQRIRFEVVGPGKCTLTLAYRRPWETGKAPARTFNLQVNATVR